MKTELDYAFLAEYAKTERGTITAIGASFTEAKSSSFPSVLDVSVAGRIRRPETEPVPEIRIVLTGPGLGESPQIDFDLAWKMKQMQSIMMGKSHLYLFFVPQF